LWYISNLIAFYRKSFEYTIFIIPFVYDLKRILIYLIFLIKEQNIVTRRFCWYLYHFNNVRKSILHIQHILTISYWTHALYPYWGRRGRNRIVVGFATTYADIAYHHWCRELESRWGWGVQHYVIKFVNDLRLVGSFLRVLRFPSPIKLTATI
jgi:hypothetical protein